jgi:hypothetical protein
MRNIDFIDITQCCIARSITLKIKITQLVRLLGSHNMTGFALMGLNGEASIMIEGEVDHPEFQKIRDHIEQARSEAVLYDISMKEAYSWWTLQFMEGLTQKTKDIPRTMIIVKRFWPFANFKMESRLTMKFFISSYHP